MRVLMIPSFFRNKDNISSGSFFSDQAILMKKKGHDVSIVFADTYSLKHIAEYFHYMEKNEILSGVPVFRDRIIAPLKHNGILGNERAFVNCCLKIVENTFYKDFSFDIIHAQNCVWAGAAAKALSQKYGVPYIITEHSSMFELADEKTMDAVGSHVSQILNDASAVICVSERLKRAVNQYTNNCITVIGNVVDSNVYSLVKRSRSDTSPFVFTAVAFLTTADRVELKGVDLLLKGFKVFVKENTNSVLKIIGVPQNFSYISQMVLEEGLDGKVSILKPLLKEQIFSEYKTTDCFVLLSKYETFGLVYAEAMATGLPVITTDVGIAAEIVNESTGVVCYERTPECVADALSKVYARYKTYDAKAIREKIISKYDKNAVAFQIEKVYRSI